MLTMTSVLARTIRLFGERPAVLTDERSFTWDQFGKRVACAAGCLRACGIKPGGRFGIVSRNSFHYAELLYGGYWMGAVPVPINHRLAPPEIGYVLDNADCKLLIVEDAFVDLLQAQDITRWSGNALVIGNADEAAGYPRYEELLSASEEAPMREAAEDEAALLLYTGGTTGRAKGVPLTHRNIVSNNLQVGFAFHARADDVYLHIAPMFHSADLLATAYTIAGGGHAFLPKFSPEAVLRAIQSHRITSTMMTPTMLIMALEQPDLETYDLSSLRQIFYGSSPMAAEWIARMLDKLEGVEIVQGYGLTETSPILTMLSMADHERALASGEHDLLKSAGRPIAGVDMRIVSERGDELGTGDVGEAVVRGPNVASTYLKRPEETAAAFRDGWFYTGDIGRMDERGYLHLLDRKKDMIITGGENVFSLEVEAVLYQHPGVRECAVVGVPDETYGEALLAAIVPVSGATLSAEDMIAHCRGKIGGYKIPRRYVFLDQLPKSAMDKILKHELRRLYAKQSPS